MIGPAGVRRATRSDRSAVTATVAQAFADDQAWRYLLGADYLAHAPHFAGALFDGRVDDGTVWLVADGSAVAMWDRPRTAQATGPMRPDIWEDYAQRVGPAASARLAAYDDACSQVKPITPYWYLGVLATRPDRQRQGLASAVMAPALALADEAGVACCLETSSTKNRAYYDARGFTLATPVPWSGPATWWLRRPCLPA